MIYLLDTHVILWAFYDSSELSNRAKMIVNTEQCCISVATLWELAIKSSLGKIKLKQSIQEIADKCEESGIELINIRPEHCQMVASLPFIHKDPFDRLLIAQALVENFTIITKDSLIPLYPINIVR